MGTSARGSAMVLAELAAAGIPVRGRAHRRRVGSLVARPADGGGARRRDPCGLANPRIRHAFLASLAVAGHNGTLRDRLPALGAVVRGQDGHDEHRVHALRPRQRRRCVFAVLQNGSPVAFWPARVAQDRFVDLACARSQARPPTVRPRSPTTGVGGDTEQLDEVAARRATVYRRAFWAFASFEPGLSPTITPAVFFETESETLAPSASSASFTSLARECLERPGDDVLLARERPLDRPLRLAGAHGRARATRARGPATTFSGSANHSATSSARSGPIPSRQLELLLARVRSARPPTRSGGRGSAPAPSRSSGC